MSKLSRRTIAHDHDVVHASRGLPGRPLLPHGPQQIDGGRQGEAVDAGQLARRDDEQYNIELPIGFREFRRQSGDAVREYGAPEVSRSSRRLISYR